MEMLQYYVMGFGAAICLLGLSLLVFHKLNPGDHEMEVMGVKLKMTAPPYLIVFMAGAFILVSPMIFPTVFQKSPQPDIKTATNSSEASSQSSSSESASAKPSMPPALAGSTALKKPKQQAVAKPVRISQVICSAGDVPKNTFVISDSTIKQTNPTISQIWHITSRSRDGEDVKAVIGVQSLDIDIANKVVYYTDPRQDYWKNGAQFCAITQTN